MKENSSTNGSRKKQKGHNGSNRNKSRSWIWILFITTIFLSMFMSSTSSMMVQKINLATALLMLSGIILIGIIFDIVGIAVAVADETPFHAMASSKVKGAKNAIYLVKNASKVTTFCNDVVGDVCSVISGSTSAFIVLRLSETFVRIDITLLGIIISALVAALTVLGKGLGKTVAISRSNQIVYKVSLLMYYLFRKIDIKSIFARDTESREDRNE